MTNTGQTFGEYDNLRARIAELEAENARLLEILKPYANSPYATIDLGDSDPDTHLICEGVTITDMRRAHAAYNKETEGSA